MAIGESFLYKAIHSEIVAREAYKAIAEKIGVPDGKAVMVAMSAEEDRHRAVLSARYRALTKQDFAVDPELKPGPNFDFIDKSAFGHTEALDALSLCLSAEIDAISHYSRALSEAENSEDRTMLKSLLGFEKKHKKKLEREIKRLKETNHWML